MVLVLTVIVGNSEYRDITLGFDGSHDFFPSPTLPTPGEEGLKLTLKKVRVWVDQVR
jgi:hypothetical protein